MIDKIDLTKLDGSKKASLTYYVNYFNNELMPYFQTIESKERNIETDKLVFSLMFFAIKHYEKYKTEYIIGEKQKLLFHLCRASVLLASQIVNGKKDKEITDEYVIRNSYGFEDTSIFKDLKYLQKITVYNRTDTSPDFYGIINQEEIEGMLHDIVLPLKNIIELELNEYTTPEEKKEERKKYLEVTQYPNIFSIAAFYRETERLGTATDHIKKAVVMLTEPIQNIDHSLLVALRAVTAVGEFASQKNMAYQTKLDNDEFNKTLHQVIKIANKIVKPTSYNFTQKVKDNIKLNDLKQQFELLLEGLETLIRCHKDTPYAEKVEYYTKPLKPQELFLPLELIEELNKLINNEFSNLQNDEKEEVKLLFSSPKEEKIIGKIYSLCKRDKEKKIEISNKYKELIQNVKNYKPPQDLDTLPSTISEIEKLTLLLEDEEASNTPMKESASKVLNVIKDFMGNDLPEPMQDDNPLAIPLNGMWQLQDKLIIWIANQYIDIPYPSEKTTEIVQTINYIVNYKSDYLCLPKKFFGVGDNYLTSIEIDTPSLLFQNYVNNHPEEVLDYLINYGKFVHLCKFIQEENNQEILESLFQISYNLNKMAEENDPLIKFTFPEEEYRALRHSIRHYEDNFDVSAVPVHMEQMYAHYAIRLTGEEEFYSE